MTRRSPWWPVATVLLAGVALLPAAFAQAPPRLLPGIVDPHVTPAEKARIDARAARFAAARQAVVANKTLSDAQKRAKIDQLAKSANTDTLAIMTPAQRKIVASNRIVYAQALGAQQARRQAFAETHQSEISTGQALTAKLNSSITPAEKQQMEPIKAAAQAQYQAIVGDPKTSPQDKQQKLRAMQQDMQAKILAVLNPAQRAQAQQIQQLQQKLQAEAQAASH